MHGPKVQLILIGGMLAVEGTAKPYYVTLSRRLGAKLMFLPNGGKGPIEETCHEMTARIDDYVGDEPALVLGHSEGGLVAGWYLANHPNARCIGLSSPYHGTKLCHLGGPIKGLFPAIRDMTPGSDFLRKLDHRLRADVDRLTSIYTLWDGLIIPTSSSHVDGANNVRVSWLHNHFTEILSPTVHREIIKAKRQAIEAHYAALGIARTATAA